MNRLALAGLLLFAAVTSAPAADPAGTPSAPPPTVYATGPLLFRQVPGGGTVWEVRHPDGALRPLVLTAVTPNYVELYDAVRKVRYRLRPDRLEVINPTGPIPNRPGRWVR